MNASYLVHGIAQRKFEPNQLWCVSGAHLQIYGVYYYNVEVHHTRLSVRLPTPNTNRQTHAQYPDTKGPPINVNISLNTVPAPLPLVMVGTMFEGGAPNRDNCQSRRAGVEDVLLSHQPKMLHPRGPFLEPLRRPNAPERWHHSFVTRPYRPAIPSLWWSP